MRKRGAKVKNDNIIACPICNSDDLVKINTYKHYCYVCNDCNNIFHIKKEKYLLEYILPKSIFKKFCQKRHTCDYLEIMEVLRPSL